MRHIIMRALVTLCLVASCSTYPVTSIASSQPASTDKLRLVVVVTRHGVRSPTSPGELAPYTAQPWPAWEVGPGNLTPHGAALMKQFGSYYRTLYGVLGVFPNQGCPAHDSMFVWADVDQRTLATGRALIDGIAPKCGFTVGHASGKEDLLFDPLPTLGRADSAVSKASILGAVGNDPNAIVSAYQSAYATLDTILGCTTSCKRISLVATTVDSDPDTGLAGVAGGLDAAGTAAENLLLAYADGQKDVGWGRADSGSILVVMALHALKTHLEHETYYGARAEGSNILSHIASTIDQAASGRKSTGTRAPITSRFVMIVGHDSTLAKLAGMLRLSWLMNGYQMNDTPPGGALVFELYQPAGAQAYVRLYFVAQALDDMRKGDGSHPNRVPVYIPGCPGYACPIGTFDALVSNAADRRFVGRW